MLGVSFDFCRHKFLQIFICIFEMMHILESSELEWELRGHQMWEITPNLMQYRK